MFQLSKCAQVQSTTGEDTKYFNTALKELKDNSKDFLSFHKVEQETVKLMVILNASFASNNENSSQICYVITISGKKGHSNILHYSSTKFPRVTRSVLAAELFSMFNDFDISIHSAHSS